MLARRLASGLSAAILLIAMLPQALAQNAMRSTLFGAVDERLEAARALNAEQLSPVNFAQAMESYAEAEEDFARGRDIDGIRSALTEADRLLVLAIEAADIIPIFRRILETIATIRFPATFYMRTWPIPCLGN